MHLQVNQQLYQLRQCLCDCDWFNCWFDLACGGFLAEAASGQVHLQRENRRHCGQHRREWQSGQGSRADHNHRHCQLPETVCDWLKFRQSADQEDGLETHLELGREWTRLRQLLANQFLPGPQQWLFFNVRYYLSSCCRVCVYRRC